ATDPPINTQPLVIGAAEVSNGTVQSPWKGQIDDLQIWTVARTSEEIATTIHSAPDLAAPGLAAYWNFDEGQGTVAHDGTGHGNDGTLTATGTGAALPQWVASGAPLTVLDPPVTVRVDDGRGGFDTQSYTILDAPGEIQGTVFNDVNGDGVRTTVPAI